MQNKEVLKINNLSIYLQNLEKGQQFKLKENGQKESSILDYNLVKQITVKGLHMDIRE